MHMNVMVYLGKRSEGGVCRQSWMVVLLTVLSETVNSRLNCFVAALCVIAYLVKRKHGDEVGCYI